MTTPVPPLPPEPPGEDLNALMRRRREELDELLALGIEPYPHAYERTDTAAAILAAFTDDAPRRTVAVAGRIMSLRRMGKATFCHIQDMSGKIQAYLKKDDLGAIYDALRLLDIGDIVGIRGFVFRTRMGEVSIHAEEVRVLAKSLRPLPVVKERTDETGAKVVYDPFADKELRYRQRYVDLAVNPAVRDVFLKRRGVMASMRKFFDARGWLEVETPVLQPLYGGASARPFTTHHNALDIDLFLRIADELYLKRLLVGGFDGVYEFAKDFRNEGMDRMHNPEFTMLELYVAYKDYVWMMGLVEELVGTIARDVNGTMRWQVGGNTIDVTPPWKRMTMFESIAACTGEDLRTAGEPALRKAAAKLHVETEPGAGAGAIIDAIFSSRVQPQLIQPTFITDYPLSMSPLAKRHRTEEGLVERFEAYVNGHELCNAFSELNDPLDQRRRFEEQMKLRARGDEEAQVLDEDFLRALEYGMPPAAGLGIGIDRLVMVVADQESIRDVIFFPQMRPERS